MNIQRPLLARQVALAFAAVGVLAAAMCALMLVIISDVSGLIAQMRHDEGSIRQGLELATAVRELSIEIDTAVIGGADLSSYEERRNQVRARIQELSPQVPEREHWRLQVLAEHTQRLHDVLMSSALPAVRAGNEADVRRIHETLATLGAEAASHADALAQATASKMAHAHSEATDATRVGLIGGGVFVLLIIGFSIWFTQRLRAAVLKPLGALTHAARAFGSGNFEHRVGAIGRGEFAELGEAFDHMADELARREAHVVRHERMAAIGQLAAGIAHELNNPIGIIRGYLKTMRPDADRETLAEELAILDEEAAQCQRIAEDLVAYSRTDELVTTAVEFDVFLRETGERFGESAAGQNFEIRVDAQPGQAQVDRTRLRQVVLNLLTNAAQASPPGAAIKVRGEIVGDTYRIEVEDTGPGVPQADRERIFEPFFSKRPGGTGLGLAVCLGIVRAHKGELEVFDATSSAGSGAVFRVNLPREVGG